MKKLVVLISALALMAIALPVMASNVTISGTATFGATYGPNPAGDTAVSSAMGDSTVHIAGAADKNNTVNVELWGDGLGTAALQGTAATGTVGIGSFYLQSDIGGALNLGSMVDPVLYAGYSTATLPGYGVTAYGSEDIAGLGIGGEGNGLAPSESGAAQAVIAVDTSVNKMFNILVGVNPASWMSTGSQFVVGAYGTVGPVSVEAGYSGNGATSLSDGAFAAGALVNYTVSDIALGATAQLVYDLASNSTSTYSAGLSATYNKMATVGAGLVGEFGATSGMKEATANVSFNPIPAATLEVGTLFNLQSGAANTFDTLDASVGYTIGATTVHLGYLYSPATSGQVTLNGTAGGPSALNGPDSGQNGVYLKASLAF